MSCARIPTRLVRAFCSFELGFESRRCGIILYFCLRRPRKALSDWFVVKPQLDRITQQCNSASRADALRLANLARRILSIRLIKRSRAYQVSLSSSPAKNCKWIGSAGLDLSGTDLYAAGDSMFTGAQSVISGSINPQDDLQSTSMSSSSDDRGFVYVCVDETHL